MRLGYGSHEFYAIIDDRFWDSLDLILLDEVHELGGFYDVGSDMFIFNGKLMSQTGYFGTVGSGWGHKYLHMQVLIYLRECALCLLAQLRLASRDMNEVLDQC